jgi:hypothetical protein
VRLASFSYDRLALAVSWQQRWPCQRTQL